ncbi:MAG: HAD family hydrolase [Acutalibacter sp.]|jgi:phosphoglycolate phosphatase
MKYDGILFDLDGTLWDATDAIAVSWAQALKDAPDVDQLPTREQLESVMGMTAEDLMATLFPKLTKERHLELFDRCCQVENIYLREHGGKLYPRMEETLTQLSEKLPLFIVSNCNKEYIPCFLDAHQLHAYFQDWECIGRTGLPKGENIRLVAQRNQLQRPVYIGDTAMDQDAAEKAGVPFLHAAYGFGKVTGAPEIQEPQELLQLLED